MRSLAASLGGLLLTACLAALGPAPATAATDPGDRPSLSTPSARVLLSTLRTGIIRETNEQRRAHGRNALRKHSCLMRNAQRHALRLARLGSLRHQDLDVVFRQCSASGRVGENVLYAYSGDPAESVRLWMDSPGHRANILHQRYRRIGVGAAYDLLTGRYYAVQVFATAVR